MEFHLHARMHIYLSLNQQNFSFNIWAECVTFFIKKINAVYKIIDVSDKRSWFSVKVSFSMLLVTNIFRSAILL